MIRKIFFIYQFFFTKQIFENAKNIFLKVIFNELKGSYISTHMYPIIMIGIKSDIFILVLRLNLEFNLSFLRKYYLILTFLLEFTISTKIQKIDKP